MRNLFLTGLVLLVSSTSWAARDSVGVFYRSEKVVVLINDGASFGRLQKLMDLVGAETHWRWLSSDESIKLECARIVDENATCTFRFLPSDSVEITERRVRAVSNEIQFPRSFEMSFTSSMEDQLQLYFGPEGLNIWAGKRGASF